MVCLYLNFFPLEKYIVYKVSMMTHIEFKFAYNEAEKHQFLYLDKEALIMANSEKLLKINREEQFRFFQQFDFNWKGEQIKLKLDKWIIHELMKNQKLCHFEVLLHSYNDPFQKCIITFDEKLRSFSINEMYIL